MPKVAAQPYPENGCAKEPGPLDDAEAIARELIRFGREGQTQWRSVSTPMRWLLIVLIVSVCALVAASAGVAWHIWRQHRKPSAAGGVFSEKSVHEESDIESEEHYEH